MDPSPPVKLCSTFSASAASRGHGSNNAKTTAAIAVNPMSCCLLCMDIPLRKKVRSPSLFDSSEKRLPHYPRTAVLVNRILHRIFPELGLWRGFSPCTDNRVSGDGSHRKQAKRPAKGSNIGLLHGGSHKYLPSSLARGDYSIRWRLLA